MNTEQLQQDVMSWDDEIQNDGNDYVLIPEGDYNFKIVEFERGNFPGSDKMAASPKAILSLEVDVNGKKAFCKDDIILNRVLEWKLAQFFRAIGLKKHGEAFRPDWTKVLGAEGRAHFKTRKGNDGKDYNRVEKYLEYDEKNFPHAWVKDAEKAPMVEEW